MLFHGTIQHAIYSHSYSLFDKHPEVRETYFQPMLSNSSDLKITLEKHGSKVVNALGVIVLALQTEDEAKLLGKVKEVLYKWKSC